MPIERDLLPPTEPIEPPRERPEEGRRLRGPLLAALGVIVLAAVAVGGFVFGSQANSDEVATGAESSVDGDQSADGVDGGEGGEDPATGDTGTSDVNVDVATGDVDDEADDAVDGAVGDEADDASAEGNGDGNSDADERVDEPPASPSRSALQLVADGVDQLGRPLPALPRFLVNNTKNPESLRSYYGDPPRVPESGPYTVVRGGFLFLRGTVASENLRQELIRRNLLVTSRDSLLIEYEVDGSDEWYLDQPIPLFFEDSVLFDVGESDLQLDALTVFLQFAQLIELGPEITLDVIGHTDSIGDEAANLQLSQGRVAAVKEAFVALGAPEAQIVAVAKGESEPVASNDTEEGRAANRRVEFAIRYEAPEITTG